MKRLKQVYAAGGPSNFDFSAGKVEKPKFVEPIAEKKVEVISEEVSEETEEIEEIEEND